MKFKALAVALGLLAISGCGSIISDAEAADIISISAQNFMFSPATLTVKSGSTVTWTNLDEEAHTVVSDLGLFRSGALDTKDSFSFKFEKAGTYHYLCSIHPKMLGTVVVQ